MGVSGAAGHTAAMTLDDPQGDREADHVPASYTRTLSGSLPREGSVVFVVWFDDMRGSMAMKEEMPRAIDEAAFQRVRKEHGELVTAIITRDGEGQS